MQDVKMTDQIAGHEIAGHENAGHENDGPKMTTGGEMAGEKSTVSTEIALQWIVQIFKPVTLNTLCIRDYLFLKLL